MTPTKRAEIIEAIAIESGYIPQWTSLREMFPPVRRDGGPPDLLLQLNDGPIISGYLDFPRRADKRVFLTLYDANGLELWRNPRNGSQAATRPDWKWEKASNLGTRMTKLEEVARAIDPVVWVSTTDELEPYRMEPRSDSLNRARDAILALALPSAGMKSAGEALLQSNPVPVWHAMIDYILNEKIRP